MNAENLLRLGTSSFSEKDWVGPFYPEKTKPTDYLKYYTTQFNTVEIDATYYAVPAQSTVDRWAQIVPDNFLVCAKFPRAIVHAGDGARPDQNKILEPEFTYDIRDQFLDNMSRLGDKLGPLLIQFPYFNKSAFGSDEPFMEKLDRFLTDLPKDFRYAVEIRNRHWLKPGFAEMLRRHNVALTLVDQGWMPHGDEVEKMFDPVTTDFAYIRLLGDRKEIEAITKSWDREVIDHGMKLTRWSSLISKYLKKKIPCMVYFNNHYSGHAPTTARRLETMVQEQLLTK